MELVKGQRGLARALGVSAKTANKYVSRDTRWKFGKGPWTPEQIAKAKDWRKKYYPPEGDEVVAAPVPVAAKKKSKKPATVEPVDSNDDVDDDIGDLANESIEDLRVLIRALPPERRIKAQQIIERTATQRVEREMLLGGYIKKEDVEQGRIARIQGVRQELGNIRLLAIKMEGKTMIEREQILEEWARSVCRKFERVDSHR